MVLGSIFINYRRNDSEGEAGRLFDELANRFSENSVFMDVSAIEPGKDFRKAIDQSVATCSVLLAMIGLEWLETKDAQGRRRLDDAGDFVRIELASALRRDIPVVPVLVRGAKMPVAEQLPDDLKELAFRNAVELTHARWKSDVQILVRALQPHIGVDADCESARAIEPPPKPPTATAIAALSLSGAIDAATVERIGKALATYIGPIAEVVARRAAKRASSLGEFYETTAREIANETTRAQFLLWCRTQGR